MVETRLKLKGLPFAPTGLYSSSSYAYYDPESEIKD